MQLTIQNNPIIIFVFHVKMEKFTRSIHPAQIQAIKYDSRQNSRKHTTKTV